MAQTFVSTKAQSPRSAAFIKEAPWMITREMFRRETTWKF